MPEKEVLCRYTYTIYEFKRVQWAVWTTNRKVILVIALPLLILGLGLYGTYSDQTSAPPPDTFDRPSLLMSFLTNEIPPAIFSAFFVYLCVYNPRKVFRKGVVYNREIVYCLSDEGIQCRTPLMGVDAKWEAVSHFIETRDGFQIAFAGNPTTNWLPKNGLESADMIEQTRTLARKHVKKPRLLSTAA